jgi:acid phosphatase
MAASNQDVSAWNSFQWRRKMEAFGNKDESVVAIGATGEIEGIWQVESQSAPPTKRLTASVSN